MTAPVLIPVPYRLICPIGVPALHRHLAPIVTRLPPRLPALHRHLAPGTRFSERIHRRVDPPLGFQPPRDRYLYLAGAVTAPRSRAKLSTGTGTRSR